MKHQQPKRIRSARPQHQSRRAHARPHKKPLDAASQRNRPQDSRPRVGLMSDGSALASSVVGMDHCVRTFHRLTGVPLHEVVRMASLTPARIVGWEREIGSIEAGKRADLLRLERDLSVRQVFVGGERIA